jgi:hypothetical protein
MHQVVEWKKFCTACRADGAGFCSSETRATMNRFYARYRLALGFEAVHVRGYSEQALRGYTAGLRLLAAYSASEVLGRATDNEIPNWGIIDPKLATGLRKSLAGATANASGIFANRNLKKRLDPFMEGDDDVRVAATALRVMVAHGTFTPTGTDSLTKAGAHALQQLSDVLLQQCDQRFNAWLGQKLQKHGHAA